MAIVNNSGGAYTGSQNQAAAALEFAVWTALYNSQGYGTLGGSSWAQPALAGTTATYYDTFINGLTSSGITGPQYTGNILEGTGALAAAQHRSITGILPAGNAGSGTDHDARGRVAAVAIWVQHLAHFPHEPHGVIAHENSS